MHSMKTFLALALLASAPASFAAGDQAPRPRMDVAMSEFSLNTTVLDFPSGLRFFIQEDSSHPIATVYTYVGHGFNDDPEGAEETAHFVEHLWFRSVHGDMPPIMFLIQDLGTMFNATTAADRTDYRTTAHIDYLPVLLKLESLRMTDFYRGVTEEQIDVEREVIRNEWRRRNEQSTSQLIDYLNEVVYPEGHPYSRASDHDTLNNITLDVMKDYVDAYYTTQDTTITIIGDFETEQVVEMILETFDLSLFHPNLTDEHVLYLPRPNVEVPKEGTPEFEAFMGNSDNFYINLVNPDDPGTADAPNLIAIGRDDSLIAKRLSARQAPPPRGSDEPLRKEGPVDNQTVMVGWSLPAGYRDDHFNLSSVGQMAGGYVYMGLNTNFGKDVEFAGCASWPGLLATTMFCGAEIKSKRLDPENVAEKMIDQMAFLNNPDVVQAFNRQLGRTKQESFRDVLDSMDLVAAVFGSRAESIGEWGHWTGDPNYYSKAMTQIQNVDASYIASVAKQYITRNRAAVLIVDPVKSRDIASNSSSYGGASMDDALIESSDDLSLATTEAISSAYARPDLSALREHTLDNGLRIVVKPHSDAPKVHARLIFGGGMWVEPYGLHSFAARYSESRGNDPLQFAGTPTYRMNPSFMGMTQGSARPLMSFGSEQSFGFGMTAPSLNLDSALWVLRNELESLRPETTGAGTRARDRKKSLKSSWFRSGWHQRRLGNAHLFPDDPYRIATTWEQIEAEAGWGSDEVQGYLDQHLHPANTTLLIVGNVDPDQAIADAQTYFGAWKPVGSDLGARPEKATPAMPSADSRTLIFDDEKRTQTQTVLQCRLNADGEKDRYAVQVLSSMVGNQIFAQLRVKEGLAYSPGGGAFMGRDGAAQLFFTSLAVNKGVGRTVEYFRRVVERLEEGDINEDEIKLHQLRLNRSGGVGNQSVVQMANMLYGAIDKGAEWSDLAREGDLVAAVTKEDLQRLATGCLDHALVTMEGPQEVITPQLDERGFEYEIIDYEQAGMDLLWQYDKRAAKKRQKAEEKKDKKEAEQAAAEEDGSADGDETESAE